MNVCFVGLNMRSLFKRENGGAGVEFHYQFLEGGLWILKEH